MIKIRIEKKLRLLYYWNACEQFVSLKKALIHGNKAINPTILGSLSKNGSKNVRKSEKFKEDNKMSNMI